MPPKEEKKKKNPSNKWLIVAGVGVATTAIVGLIVYFLAKNKSSSLNSAWQLAGTTSLEVAEAVRNSPLPGQMAVAATPAVVTAVVARQLTIPAQTDQEVKRDFRSQTFHEMNGAFDHGNKLLSNARGDEKNYLSAAEAFRETYDLLSDIETDRAGDGFKQKRLRACLYNEAIARFHLGHYKEYDPMKEEQDEICVRRNALKNLDEILVENPHDREALNLRGLIYLKLEKLQKARCDFDLSLKIDDSQKKIYFCSLFVKNQLVDAKGALPDQKKSEDSSKEVKSGSFFGNFFSKSQPTVKSTAKKTEPQEEVKPFLKAEYYKLMREVKRTCTYDELFYNEMIFGLAKAARDEKDYADAIAMVDHVLLYTRSHPGLYPERLRLLGFLETALLEVQSGKASYNITPYQNDERLKPYTLNSDNIGKKIKEVKEQIADCKREQANRASVRLAM